LRALQRLTPRERMVFDLRHFQGLNLRSVSEILNASEASVKMTFYRATRKLRFRLDKYTKSHRFSTKQFDIRVKRPQVVKGPAFPGLI
jgi:DNA-directed RNA polymerase specialized sigma24 family protein